MIKSGVIFAIISILEYDLLCLVHDKGTYKIINIIEY
jgi:hypothetical protein